MCLIGVGGMRGCWGERGGYLFSSGPFLLLLKPVVPAAVCLSVCHADAASGPNLHIFNYTFFVFV
jgi:hypothetical protein